MDMNIYKITLPNGKIYIGQTTHDIKLRTGNDLGGYTTNTLFYIDIMIYGPRNASIEIIESGIQDQTILDEREVYWIDYFKSYNHNIGYNVQSGGKHTSNVYKDPYYNSIEYKQLVKKYKEAHRKYKDSTRYLYKKCGYAKLYYLYNKGKITKTQLDKEFAQRKQTILNKARDTFFRDIAL